MLKYKLWMIDDNKSQLGLAFASLGLWAMTYFGFGRPDGASHSRRIQHAAKRRVAVQTNLQVML